MAYCKTEIMMMAVTQKINALEVNVPAVIPSITVAIISGTIPANKPTKTSIDAPIIYAHFSCLKNQANLENILKFYTLSDSFICILNKIVHYQV